MKNNKRGLKKFVVLFLSAVVLSVVLCFSVSAADDFDVTLEKFPESYRGYLSDLHEKHPEWKFEAFETGLDWNEVVKAEYGEVSLVDNSASANILKSHDADDYNSETGSFKYKDGGFVQASQLAIEYFLDPRNFLNDEGIFQFEKLSFSEIFSVEAVELILKRSFMYDTVITYLDAQGNRITTDKKYSEVIYEAGKKYNINPCYLASKILNEVGSDGSYSVWGNHSTYPGIYNFYNIGANDGVNAITRGLAWANGGADGKLTTYSRPWNTPEKSIMGGAEFLASSYIAVGQFTGYLQRFNVNPDAVYDVYTHQYMTNLTGALSQGYTSYASYAQLGILDNQFVFSIPVFENMPQGNAQDTLVSVDSKLQYGSVNISGVNVRTGPSTTYAKLQSAEGANILLAKGTQVRILSKHFVDSTYYSRILQYPLWYKISFTYNAKTYTGYIFYHYIDILTTTSVGIGTYDLGIFSSATGMSNGIFCDNPAVCKVVDGDTVNFIKSGNAVVTIYNSRGICDRILFTVKNGINDYLVNNVSLTSDTESITVSLTKRTSGGRHGFYLADENGSFIKGGDINSNTYTFKNLQKASKYTVYCRYVNSYGFDNGPVKISEFYTQSPIVPDAPTDLSVSELTSAGYKLSWSAVGADGFRIYKYEPENKAYVRLCDTYETDVYVDNLRPGYACAFRIKAFRIIDGSRVYSDYSELFWTLTPPLNVGKPEYTDLTSRSISLMWSASEGADFYRVYLKGENEDKLIYEGSELTVIYDGLLPASAYSVYVVPVASERGITVCAEQSDFLDIVTPVASVDGFKVSDVTADSYKLSWNSIDNAAFYTVYGLVDGEYERLTSVTTPYCAFENLENSAKTFYKVTATYILDTVLEESEFSQEFSATTLPDAVTGLKGTAYEDRIDLKWDETKNADCYNIYLYENGKYVLKATVKNNSYTLEGLNDITKYYVRVRAYIRSSLGTQKGKVATYSFYTMAKTVSEMKASSVTDTSYTLTWTPSSEGVNRYNVYRYDDVKKSYIRIGYTNGATTLNVAGLTPGTTNKYCVIPYIMKNGSVLRRGYRSDDFSFSTNLGKTVNLTAHNVTSDSFTLKWDKTENATYYRVYRYDTITKKYILLSSPKTNSYEISSLEPGTKYYYKVRPVRKAGGIYYYGYYSSLFSVRTKK